MDDSETFIVKPIGRVRSSVKKLADDCWGGAVATIERDENQWEPECTLGLDQYSHAEVVFMLNRIPSDQVEKGARHPRGRVGWAKMGIFAQRSQDRPNRIGITVCEIESVDGLKIRVSELDALDATPVSMQDRISKALRHAAKCARLLGPVS
jgi:tRNA (Thr-GGU) A37 N-methylase